MKGWDIQMDRPGEKQAAAVAAQIRAERGARNMTIHELAERSGITEQSLQRYLAEKRPITVTVLYQICTGLGIDLDELIRRAESRLSGHTPIAGDHS